MLRVITLLKATNINHTSYYYKLLSIVANPRFELGSEAYETSEVANFSNSQYIILYRLIKFK